MLCPEARIAVAMTRFIGHGLIAQHTCRRRKGAARFTVEDIDRLARTVRDRVVRPWGELIIAAVACPGEGRTFRRDMEPEIRIGDHIDPRMRRVGAVVDAHHIAAVLGKATITIPETKIVPGRRRTVYYRLDHRTAFFRPAFDGDRRKPRSTQPLSGHLSRSLTANGSLGIARRQIDGDFLAATKLLGQRAVLRMHDDARRGEQRVVAFVAHLVAAHREDVRLTAATGAETFHDPVDGALCVLRIGEGTLVDRHDIDG